MKPTAVASTRGLGLDIASIAAKYLFKTDDLHYGYWPEDLAPEIGNLKCAQENYANLLLAHIPKGVHSILDVGAGTGAFAKRLIAAGYEVDCVSPAPYLTARIRQTLGNGPTIFECSFEELQTDKRYDLILFSESFQYVKMPIALSKSCERACPTGFVLISDFFRNETDQKSSLGGGHPLKDFREMSGACPLNLLVDKDITPQTAPNLDLTDDFVHQVVGPARDRIFETLGARYPLPTRFLRWCFRKELARAETKYFQNQRTGAAFLRDKSYRLMVFQRVAA